MPNWCDNEVTIQGHDNPEEFKAFLLKAQLQTEGARERAVTFDSKFTLFDNLVPMPEYLRDTTRTPGNTNEFVNALAGNGDYQYTNWYDWSLANWGTKWDVELRSVFMPSENSLHLNFDTAWSPAGHVWEKVSEEFPSLIIDMRYIEEGMAYIGDARFQGGETIKDICLDISKQMYLDAGAVLDKDGHVDWDVDQQYSLWDLFGKGLERYITHN